MVYHINKLETYILDKNNMKYRIFKLIAELGNHPVPKEFTIDRLNKLADDGWVVTTTLYFIRNESILLLQKKK